MLFELKLAWKCFAFSFNQFKGETGWWRRFNGNLSDMSCIWKNVNVFSKFKQKSNLINLKKKHIFKT